MRKKHSNHNYIIEQVPPNYYQSGVKNNFFQRFWHISKLHEVINMISLEKRNKYKILDIGCASGWFLSQLVKKFPASKGYGIDIYDKAIVYGKKHYPKLTLKIADAHKIPYQAKFFDVIICTEVLEHVDDPLIVLHEIKRVLKKGGTAIIELDSGSILFSIVWYLWRQTSGKVWNDAHLHSFTVKKLEKAILKSGLKITRRKTFNVGMAMVFSVTKN